MGEIVSPIVQYLLSATTPTISTAGFFRRLPTASPFHNRRASVSLTMATAGAPCRSCQVKSRPARRGMRTVRNHPGVRRFPWTQGRTPDESVSMVVTRNSSRPMSARGTTLDIPADSTPGTCSRRRCNSTKSASLCSGVVDRLAEVDARRRPRRRIETGIDVDRPRQAAGEETARRPAAACRAPPVRRPAPAASAAGARCRRRLSATGPDRCVTRAGRARGRRRARSSPESASA